MVFREVRNDDCYCNEPEGKGLTKKIINLLNKPENAETVRQVLLSDKRLLKPATFMLLPFTKRGDFPGTKMGGAGLGNDQIDAHNITHGILTLVHDDSAKKSEHWSGLKSISDEMSRMVESAKDCELKRLILGNVEKQQDKSRTR